MSITRFKECVRDGFSNPDMAAKLYKGGGATNTVTNADPWIGSQPYMFDYMKRGAANSRIPSSYVPDSFGKDTEQSFGMMRDFSGTDPTYGQAGMDSLMKTANGDFLGANPYLDSMLNQSMDQTNAMFQSGGRYGSAGHAGAMAQGLGAVRANDYARERGLMMDAGKFLPMGQQLMDSATMGRIGARQGVGGAIDADTTARWDFAQNEPWNRLSRYASLINPGAGMGGTQSSSGTMPGGSKLAGAAGGALMGGMAGSSLAPMLGAMGPYGMAIGAGLGLLGGMYA